MNYSNSQFNQLCSFFSLFLAATAEWVAGWYVHRRERAGKGEPPPDFNSNSQLGLGDIFLFLKVGNFLFFSNCQFSPAILFFWKFFDYFELATIFQTLGWRWRGEGRFHDHTNRESFVFLSFRESICMWRDYTTLAGGRGIWLPHTHIRVVSLDFNGSEEEGVGGGG